MAKIESITQEEKLTQERDSKTHRITIVFDKDAYELLEKEADKQFIPVITYGRSIILKYLAEKCGYVKKGMED
jgi:hypothetical protein